MSTRQIFLSHSSADGALATLLANEIEQELGDGFRVFASTRADAIDNGHKWFDVILKRMDEADALVVLITESGKNSAWVGFELGYFWRKDSIYPLHHPRVPLPAPFSALQSKKIIVREELNNFFDALCDKLGVKRSGKADLDAIIKLANKIIVIPVSDKSLGKFIEYLENSRWTDNGQHSRGVAVLKEYYHLWICQDMTEYGIEIADLIHQDLFKSGKQILVAKVYLKISDRVIATLEFMRLKVQDEKEHFVPVPQNPSSMKQWSKNSLAIKVARIIGEFGSIAPSTPEEFDRELEKIAHELGIQIVE